MKREETIAYEIYVQSFMDSNADGIGDLNGIILKLDYLKDLGINLIWLTPIYESPMEDNGYDISNYYKINPIYGTLADFEKLILEAKNRGIKIMLDMVFNHTSTKHPWFQKAIAGEKKYQDYYFFKDGFSKKNPPTNWSSKFGGPAWEYNEQINKWYLHLFLKSHADLNWDNKEVREEIYKIVKYWGSLGVEGFRFDVINLISKPEIFLDSKTGDGKEYYTDGPNVHKYINYLNRHTFGKDPKYVTVGEMSSTTIENSIRYSHFGNRELSMVFTFHHLKVDYQDGKKWTDPVSNLDGLIAILTNWISEISNKGGWLANFLSNHDQPRHVSRFGDDTLYHYESATAFATMYILLRGTPFIFQGEEIGTPNANRKTLDQFLDIESKNYIEILKEKGLSEEHILEIVNYYSRDNGRLTMYWDDSTNGGFSKVTPWIIPSNIYKQINVQAQNQVGKKSILNFYKDLISYRKNNHLIQFGEIVFKQFAQEVMAYYRIEGQKSTLVIVNLSNESVFIDLEKNLNIVINNYSFYQEGFLQPYQCLVIEE